MLPKSNCRTVLWIWLNSFLLPLACKTPDQAPQKDSAVAGEGSGPTNRYLASELKHLNWIIANKEQSCTRLNTDEDWSPPAIIGRLYQFGLEKPPSPKAELGHQSLQSGGYMALRRAFFMATADASRDRENCQRELVELLEAWTKFPVKCFEFDKSCPYLTRQPVPDTSNRYLELTWLMSNLIRAATILEDFPPQDPNLNVESTLEGFKQWAGDVLDTYVIYKAFAAGNSNRKASQIETLLRYGILTKNAAMIAAQKLSFQNLLSEIKSQGELCEDTLRDKFHPQFFVASALNIEALFRNKTNLKIQNPALALGKSAPEKCAPMDVPFQVNPDDEEKDDIQDRDDPPNTHENGLSLKLQADDPPPFPSDSEISEIPTFMDERSFKVCSYPPNLPACRRAAFQEKKEQTSALSAFEAAIIYTAASNLTDSPPKGYESSMYLADPPQNWRPAYNIPTWYRAARYFMHNEKSVPMAVQCMLEANYFKFNCDGRFDLSKSWGYSAIADHFGI